MSMETKNKRSILLGQADWKSLHSAEQRQQVEALLLGQRILSIQWYEDIGILRIAFSNGYALDMFHDSSFLKAGIYMVKTAFPLSRFQGSVRPSNFSLYRQFIST